MKLPLVFFGVHFWKGESGKRYLFKCALTKRGIPEDSGGIYVFVKRHFAFFLQPLYVGKASNLRGRLVGHEKWGKAWWILGATERHVMRVASEEEERRMIEEDLIRGLKPRNERRADAPQRGRCAEHAAASQELDLAPEGGGVLPQAVRHGAERSGSDLSQHAPASHGGAGYGTARLLVEETRVGFRA